MNGTEGKYNYNLLLAKFLDGQDWECILLSFTVLNFIVLSYYFRKAHAIYKQTWTTWNNFLISHQFKILADKQNCVE